MNEEISKILQTVPHKDCVAYLSREQIDIVYDMLAETINRHVSVRREAGLPRYAVVPNNRDTYSIVDTWHPDFYRMTHHGQETISVSSAAAVYVAEKENADVITDHVDVFGRPYSLRQRRLVLTDAKLADVHDLCDRMNLGEVKPENFPVLWMSGPRPTREKDYGINVE